MLSIVRPSVSPSVRPSVRPSIIVIISIQIIVYLSIYEGWEATARIFFTTQATQRSYKSLMYGARWHRRLYNTAVNERVAFTQTAYMVGSRPLLGTVQACGILQFLMGWRKPTNQSSGVSPLSSGQLKR